MTPTRDGQSTTKIDTGTGSVAASRPDVWAYAGPHDVPGSDTGIGSPVAARPDLAGTGSAFIPPAWL